MLNRKNMKMKKIKIFIIALATLITSVTLVSFKDNDFEIAKNLDIFYTLFKEVNIFYVDETDPGKLIKTAIDAMLASLDPYTNYIPESKIEDYKFMTTGQYGGIGAMIRKDSVYIVVTDPYEGFPAQKAGLKAGDIITEINGKSTKGKNTKQVSEMLKGQPGTQLHLKIQRLDTMLNIDITREEIKLNSVPYYAMVSDSVGYIRFTRFTRGGGKEVRKAMEELKNQGAKALILDLRGNPGGLLIEAVNISNLFVDKGDTIVFTKGKVKQWDKVYKAYAPALDKEIPLAVLVDRSSASASEIVSGSLQDLDRAVIIGERSFGKGLVQTTRKLSYNAQLKVTTAKYYIPSGRCIQALDYTHRREDGSVGKIPDSLITEYKTRNGRIVYDGGGILPDVIKEPETLSAIATSLLYKNMIFDYATYYARQHDSIPPVKDFKISDDDFNDFVNFIKGKDFDYETFTDEKFKELENMAKKEKYYEIAKDEFAKLKEKISHDKFKDLQTFKDEIEELLAEEIVSRYYYQKGRIEKMLESDPNIDTALSVLHNPNRYNKILNKNQ